MLVLVLYNGMHIPIFFLCQLKISILVIFAIIKEYIIVLASKADISMVYNLTVQYFEPIIISLLELEITVKYNVYIGGPWGHHA